MKRLFLATLTVAAVAVSPALAADLGSRAPVVKAPVMAQPAFSWSGIYIGGDAGWMESKQEANWFLTALPARVFKHDKSSGILSGHVGAQMQFSNWVLGVEGSGIFRSNELETGTPNSGCPNPAFTCQASLDRLWTVGPRLGVVLGNYWLPYVTGGYASGRIRSRSFTTATGVVFDDLSKNDNGWFFGGGLEYAIPVSANWAFVLGAEYKHIDLGTTRFLSVGGVLDTNSRDIKTSADVVAARLSIKMN
jgi:outer membrane immunogenic protein